MRKELAFSSGGREVVPESRDECSINGWQRCKAQAVQGHSSETADRGRDARTGSLGGAIGRHQRLLNYTALLQHSAAGAAWTRSQPQQTCSNPPSSRHSNAILGTHKTRLPTHYPLVQTAFTGGSNFMLGQRCTNQRMKSAQDRRGRKDRRSSGRSADTTPACSVRPNA